MEVTEQALIDFYKEVDESKLESVKTIAAKYQSKTAKLMRMLKKNMTTKHQKQFHALGIHHMHE